MIAHKFLIFVSALVLRRRGFFGSTALDANVGSHMNAMAMNPNGRWLVLESNDALMPSGAEMCIENGQFVVHNVVRGSFELDHSKKGVCMNVRPFNLGFLERQYEVQPISHDSMRVSNDRYAYTMKRLP